MTGFIGLSLSAPQRSFNLVRYAWAGFDTHENCQNAKDQIDGL